MRTNLYERITQQVINNLNQAGSWQQLWDVPQPVSLNEHQYQGINHLLLSTSNYESPVWGTFNQVRQNGGTVNRGETSRLIVFWKKSSYLRINRETGEMSDEHYFLLRYYSVFNTEQCTFDQMGEKKIHDLSRASESRFNERFLPAEQIIRHAKSSQNKLRIARNTMLYSLCR